MKSIDFLTESGTGKLSLNKDDKLFMTYWMMHHANFHNHLRITDYIIDRRTNRINGFVDPRSGIKFQTCDPDYHGRKKWLITCILYMVHLIANG